MSTATVSTLAPVYFTPPLLNPSPGGLWPAVSWTEEDTPRWLGEGVAFESAVTGNFGGDLSTGIWGASWCASPDDLTEDDLKTGVRPADPDPFLAVTSWGFDSCDLTAPSQAEVIDRAQQVLRMREPILVAREFAGRAKLDSGAATTVPDLVAAIGELEAKLADHNVIGVVHASPKLTAAAVSSLLVSRTGTGLRTPSGHLWVADGGYRPVLGDDLLIATSAVYGWRDSVVVRTTVKADENEFIAIAERSVALGCELVVSAVKVSA